MINRGSLTFWIDEQAIKFWYCCEHHGAVVEGSLTLILLSKQDNDYHQRSLSETAMYRYKQLISPKLSLRDYNAQVGEALAGVKAMNKVIGLGMPVRKHAA